MKLTEPVFKYRVLMNSFRKSLTNTFERVAVNFTFRAEP